MLDVEVRTRELESLPARHRVAFAASVCERLVPNYEAFARTEGWGEPELLYDRLEEAWQCAAGSCLDDQGLRQRIAELEDVVPNTEDFSSLFTSAALDAANSVIYTLECCLNGDAESAATVATLAVESIDMYVQEREHMDPSDPERERKIAEHPLMRDELTLQEEAIEALKKRKLLDEDFVERLRSRARSAGIQVYEAGLSAMDGDR